MPTIPKNSIEFGAVTINGNPYNVWLDGETRLLHIAGRHFNVDQLSPERQATLDKIVNTYQVAGVLGGSDASISAATSALTVLATELIQESTH